MRLSLHRYGAHCCAEQVDITEGCPKIDLFTFKGHVRELHIGWSYEDYSGLLMSVLFLTFSRNNDRQA
jgi:hypothetical protein